MKGFGYSGYRSVGDNLVKIAPLKKINLIIGKNNSGKSNIINFLKYQYPFFVKKAGKKRIQNNTEEFTFTELDNHISSESYKYRIAFMLDEEGIQEYIEQKLPDPVKHRGQRIYLKKLYNSEYFKHDDGFYWFIYESNHYRNDFEFVINPRIKEVISPNEWKSLWLSVTRFTGGGDLDGSWIPNVISEIKYIPSLFPNVEIIPAIRKIGLAGTDATDYSGEGIIERLAKIQNPPFTDQGLKQKFHTINKFVQSVLNNSTAQIEIPYERDMVLIHMDGKTLPLDSLGTGVHEVVILAAAATLLNDSILCIEEPELHLHPLLQKKLINYLSENTDNQYIFTTHSAHLLDSTEAEIFHVTHNNGTSNVFPISSTKQKSHICNDLGYKASDLLQANCIIWVEGPSDRIYIKYWLESKTLNLVEGIHYSIMFFGGRLFSHITALDYDENEEIDDFISIRNLNRNSIIVFDSDKAHAKAKINSTKKRLKDEFNKGPGFAWITKGREIENYLVYDNLVESIKSVHPSAHELVDKGEWGNLLKYKKIRSDTIRTANKTKIAQYYCNNYAPNTNILDLDEKISELKDFILRINNLQ